MKVFNFVSLITVSVLFLFSCSKGGGKNIQIDGVKGPYVNKVEDDVKVSLVVESLSLDTGLRFPVPKFENSYVEITPDQNSDGTLFSASIKIEDLLDGNVTQLPEMSLPGGRALPGVASGKLPASAFTIEKFSNTTVYVGPEVFGLFVPVKNLGMGEGILTFRYYIQGNRAGNLSVVGADANGENEGILLLLDMTETVKQKLIEKGYQF